MGVNCLAAVLLVLQGAQFRMRPDKTRRWDLAQGSQQVGAPGQAARPSSNLDSKLEAEFSRCQPSWFFAAHAIQKPIGTNSET
jgi:hypothetical protein